MQKSKFLILILFIPLVFSGCFGYEPIEKLGIVVGIGNDSYEEKKSQYSSTFEILVFKGNNEIDSVALEGKSNTIYTTINERQVKENKFLVTGAEQVYLFSEERARAGVKDVLDAFIRDFMRNEKSFVAVSKQSTKEVFSLKTPFAISTSENLHGLLEFAHNANFFSPHINLLRFMRMYTQEGRDIVVPYIQIKENIPQITGLALFKGDKMIVKVSLEEASLINLLRSSDGKGFLSVTSKKPEEYIDFNGKNKRKVKVSKENGNLKYDIFVNLNGYLTVNSLVEQNKTLAEPEKVGKIFAEQLETALNNEISKIKNNYKIDCLDLGKYAVAKYGRGKGYGSDESFCNAKIDVHVNVKVNSSGRKVDK
ncbi:Ger(x)C family spore germination protein [Clostridium ganghwense]|uniref:Ger(X)C family spore germination protein n=1 Tax=Clostridium ganghwense TaxID=312089 RepID=A0ABT4CM92_9CLOT|nr:Ger(x)C family spore germination protein [Clostridium ganghwense]MCY6370161.1 Ger(x)C family spore germination protein [Clostridium ganghwense]